MLLFYYYTTYFCMRKGAAYSRPNIISISHSQENVNNILYIITSFSNIFKSFSVTLYNIPYCIFQKLWYYITTKR